MLFLNVALCEVLDYGCVGVVLNTIWEIQMSYFFFFEHWVNSSNYIKSVWQLH